MIPWLHNLTPEFKIRSNYWHKIRLRFPNTRTTSPSWKLFEIIEIILEEEFLTLENHNTIKLEQYLN